MHVDFVVPDITEAVERADAVGARLESAGQHGGLGKPARMGNPFGNGFCIAAFVGRGYGEIATA